METGQVRIRGKGGQGMTALQLMIFGTYVFASIAVCRRRRATGGAHCGWGKCVLMPLLALFTAVSLFSPLRFVLSLRSIPEGLFPTDSVWIFVVLGLLLGGAGDTFLEIGRKTYGAGVIAFLLGHLCYLHAALLQIRLGGGVRVPAVLLAFLYLVPVFTFGRKLLQAVSGMLRAGLLCYMAAICSMSISMLLRAGTVPPLSFVLCLAGSLLFLVSDGFIGYHAFLGRRNSGIMETYTAAQALLAWGFVLSL